MEYGKCLWKSSGSILRVWPNMPPFGLLREFPPPTIILKYIPPVGCMPSMGLNVLYLSGGRSRISGGGGAPTTSLKSQVDVSSSFFSSFLGGEYFFPLFLFLFWRFTDHYF